ncbi:MAG: hypothetical protein MJZ13_05395 [Bacteroidales bacterium]|nr:hypothetical protein [Bacteroidales bacterium]
MIPKIVHYVWFGKEMPIDVKICINSWKKKLPGYRFKLWNEENFDIHSVPFVEQAYENRQYAFCADYIRLYALYTEGGIYLDTDVLVLKPFDQLLDNSFFSAIELLADPNDSAYKSLLDEHYRNRDHSKYIPYLSILSAIMGSEKGSGLIEKTLHKYDKIPFVNTDGTFNNKVIITMYLANVAEEYGYRYINEKQTLDDRVTIYPASVLACLKRYVDDKTIAVHCGLGGWLFKVSFLTHLKNAIKILYVYLKYS